MILILYVGEYWLEWATFSEPREPFQTQRHFLASQSMKQGLINSLDACKKDSSKITQVILATRQLQKLRGFRLGGSVAQIVDEGLEKWTEIWPTTLSRSFLSPKVAPSIATQDLAFGLNSDFKEEDLHSIAQKLSSMGVNRIALNLGQKLLPRYADLKNYFTQQNLEIFFEECNSQNQVQTWRKNTLNAAMAGTFKEHLQEIKEVLINLGISAPVFVLNQDLTIQLAEKSKPLSILNSVEESIFRFFNQSSFLFLNPDFFCYYQNESFSKSHSEDPLTGSLNNSHIDSIRGTTHESLYGSHRDNFSKDSLSNELFSGNFLQSTYWGELPYSTNKSHPFPIQPDDEIIFQNEELHIHFEHHLGYDAGPMRIGRGIKPLLLDYFINSNSNAFKDVIQNQDHKWQMFNKTLSRNKALSSGGIITSIQNLIFEKILHECQSLGIKQVYFYLPEPFSLPETLFREYKIDCFKKVQTSIIKMITQNLNI